MYGCVGSVNKHWIDKRKHSLLEQVVSVSVATTKEQPGLAKCGLRVLLPLLLSESQTTDVSGQSILTDEQTRWRRGSSSSQQRLKKSGDTIKHRLQWQYTECHNCLMHGNGCACCSKDIICIIKFHPNRRIDTITINSYWKWNQGLCFVCVCVCFAYARVCAQLCLSAEKEKKKNKKKNCSCKKWFLLWLGSLANLPESFAGNSNAAAQSGSEDAGICVAHLLQRWQLSPR